MKRKDLRTGDLVRVRCGIPFGCALVLDAETPWETLSFDAEEDLFRMGLAERVAPGPVRPAVRVTKGSGVAVAVLTYGWRWRPEVARLNRGVDAGPSGRSALPLRETCEEMRNETL